MNRNTYRPTASAREPKSNGGDRVVRTLRVYESGRVVPLPGRPPRDWAAVVSRARAHALPADGPTPPPPEIKVKNPAKVAAGKARAAKAAAAKLAAQAAPAKKAAKGGTNPGRAGSFGKTAAKANTKRAQLAKAKAAPSKRGGARPGSGPKPRSGDAMVVAAFRVTPAQKKKLAKLGAEWLRARIDAATVK